MKHDFIKELASSIKACQNPVDLKPSKIAKVESLNPLIVSTEDSKIFYVKDENLCLSEWFCFRCNIDSTSALSAGVPEDLSNAAAVSETHSYTGASCSMPSAVSFLSNAITRLNSELLALKCELKAGDLVVITSLEQNNKYLLIDKVQGDLWQYPTK